MRVEKESGGRRRRRVKAQGHFADGGGGHQGLWKRYGRGGEKFIACHAVCRVVGGVVHFPIPVFPSCAYFS